MKLPASMFALIESSTPEPSLFDGLPPTAQRIDRETAPVRRVQNTTQQPETLPGGVKAAQLTRPQQAQQTHRRPRHPVAASVPVAHRAQRDAQVLRAGLAAQKARHAELSEAVRGEFPDPALAWPST